MNIAAIKSAAGKVLQFFLCLIGVHEWTCAAKEGVKPTRKQLDAGMNGFRDYAKMYCKSCGKISNLS